MSLRTRLGFEAPTGRPSSTYVVTAGIATLASGLLAVLSGLVDFFDGDIDSFELWPVAGLCFGAAFQFLKNGFKPRRLGGVSVLVSVVIGWLLIVAISSIVYVVTGTIERLDDALFESMAGYTTTHLSVVSDIEALPQSMLMWRTGTQWLGGFFALVLGTTILPFWVGGREMADPQGAESGFRSFAPTPLLALRNATRFYAGFTLLCAVSFLATGAGLFDAVTYGMSTSSTGGFANHPGSIGWFESASMEWVTAVLMFISGSSVALVWWILRGGGGSALRSVEFRLYTFAVLFATVVFTAAEAQDGVGIVTSLRHGFFTSTAVVSTTGHWATSWAGWGSGAQTLLLLLIGIGSMAGSIGGGYRWMQVAESLGAVRREIVLQLHPTAAVAIKVGARTASPRSLDQMNAQRSLILVTVGVGAAVIATLGADLLTAFSTAVSAISTFGPANGDLAGTADATIFAAPARFAIAMLMFAGRLSIYPIPLAIGSLMIWGRHRWQDRTSGRGGSNRVLAPRSRPQRSIVERDA